MFSFSIAAPSLLAVGTLGNFLGFINLRGKSFGSSPTNFILSTMLVIDQSVLSLNLVEYWLAIVHKIDLPSISRVSCSAFAFLSYYLRHLSAFLVCLLTVERLIAVFVPLRCRDLCSAQN